MDEGSGTWVQRARWGTFTAGALVSKRKRSYMNIYEVDHRTINANGLWGMVVAFPAAGKVACVFTSVPRQLLIRGASSGRGLSPQFAGMTVEEQACLQGAWTMRERMIEE